MHGYLDLWLWICRSFQFPCVITLDNGLNNQESTYSNEPGLHNPRTKLQQWSPRPVTCLDTERKGLRMGSLGTSGVLQRRKRAWMDTPGTSGPYTVAGMVVSMGPRPVATQVSLGVSPVQTQTVDIKRTLSYDSLCTPRCNVCWGGLASLPAPCSSRFLLQMELGKAELT